jgi:hypothetical protein
MARGWVVERRIIIKARVCVQWAVRRAESRSGSSSSGGCGTRPFFLGNYTRCKLAAVARHCCVLTTNKKVSYRIQKASMAQTSNTHLDSYFPSVVSSLSKTLGTGYYSSVAIRPSDFYIMQKQNPVGWAFFSKVNVENMIRTAQRCNSKADFAAISEDMIHVFEVNASETPYKPEQTGLVVAMLNKLFVERYSAKCQQQSRGIWQYGKYLARPHKPAPWPTLEREDRSLRIDARNPLI